jgi:hypothetical protein
MKMVEQGRLDLHTDINQYLDFHIPDTFEEPITLAHLLTHTPGFEDIGLRTLVRSQSELVPLGQYLAENIPTRSRPPGQVAAYSNYGAALAGYIVERTTGLTFAQYMQDYILSPLEMNDSTVFQPLPPALASQMSSGYIYAQGRFQAGDYEYINLAPAGALSSTADDMANFMIAHLQNGSFKDRQILRPETVELMHSQQFVHHPDLSGMTYGWMEYYTHNQRLIWHGGDTLYFHTALVLIPEDNVGFYVSYNSLEGAQARSYFMQAFLDRYYPVPDPPSPSPPQDFSERVGRLAGTYQVTRASTTTAEKLLLLFQPVFVSAAPGNLLQLTNLGGQPSLWEEVEPLVFRQFDGTDLLIFSEDENGQVQEMYMGALPVLAFTRTTGLASPTLHLTLLGISLSLFFLALLVIPAAFFARLPLQTPILRARILAEQLWKLVAVAVQPACPGLCHQPAGHFQ